jgi:hypothetical protein
MGSVRAGGFPWGEFMARWSRFEPAADRRLVKELIAERFAWGWSPEELLVNHPDLTLGQIFSALAYYADHQAEIDQALENDLQFVDQMRRHGAGSSLMLRLRQARRR